MFSFSIPELALILVIAFVVFGPGKLPEVGKALGRGISEFRRGLDNPKQPETINVEAGTAAEGQVDKK